GQNVDQEAGREVLRGALGCYSQGVEEPSIARVRAQVDHLDCSLQPRQKVEVVVTLGIDVDDAAADEEALVEELLERHRLARAERAAEQHGRRAARSRRLFQVEEDGLPRSRQRV